MFLWGDLWPLLLLATAVSALGHTIAIVANLPRSHRVWLPVAVSGLGMSVFAFFTVLSHFTSA